MNKYYQLNEQLQKIENEIKQMSTNIEAASFSEFIKYKQLLSKKEQLKKKIKHNILAAQDAISQYNAYNERKLGNIKVSCKRYCRLQQRAEYKRDHKLYNLGVVNHKPTPPSILKIKSFFSFISKPFKKPLNAATSAIHNLKSNIIPNKIEKIAVCATKVCITGYQTIHSHLYSTKCSTYVRHIVNEAKSQINNSANYDSEAQKFRSSIQVKINSNKPSPSSVPAKNIIQYEHSI